MAKVHLPMIVVFLLSTQITTGNAQGGSCGNRCNAPYDPNLCSCNTLCPYYGNCCEDFGDHCIESCLGRCTESVTPANAVCRCSADCENADDCCLDYEDLCEAEQYFCKGNCSVEVEMCSCQEDCGVNQTCCSDYLYTCQNQTSWLEDECPTAADWSCPDRFDSSPLILMSLGGVGADYLLRNETPHIEKLAECGVHPPYMRPVYPTTTFPNLYSIVTGLYPESHGIVGNTMYDYELGEEFSNSRNNSAWWKGEPIWITAKNSGLRTAAYFWPGTDVNLTSYPDYFFPYNNNTDHEQMMYQTLKWLDRPARERPSLITLYIDEINRMGERYGPPSPKVNRTLMEVDASIGILMNGLKQRNLQNCVNVILVADHGMVPISCSWRTSLVDYGLNVESMFISTGSFGGLGPSTNPDIASQFDADQVHNSLKCTRNESRWLSYLKNQYLPKRYHYANNDRIGPVHLVMDESWSVESRQNSIVCSGGNHGYDNQYESMNAFFAAFGPGFQVKYSPENPFEVIELYNVLTDLLKIEAQPNNGTLGSLNHMMSSPPQIEAVAEANPPMCGAAEDLTQSTCPVCDGITDDELYDRLTLTEEEVTTSDDANVLFGFSFDDENICLLTQQDYVTAFNQATKMPYFSSFTLTRQSFDLVAPPDCLRPDPRNRTRTATCDQYDETNNVNPVPLYPPELSNGDAIYDAAVLSNVVPMYPAAQRVWNYTARTFADWSMSYGGINVIVGPIFDYNNDGLADSSEILQKDGKFLMNDKTATPVPTHYFAVVTRCAEVGTEIASCEENPKTLEVLSFIIPNYEEEPCEDNKEQSDFDWIPNTLKEQVARVRDVELLTGITFFTYLQDSDPNPQIQLKVHLPQFSSQWLQEFVENEPPPSSLDQGSEATIISLNKFNLMLAVFLAFVLTQNN